MSEFSAGDRHWLLGAQPAGGERELPEGLRDGELGWLEWLSLGRVGGKGAFF